MADQCIDRGIGFVIERHVELVGVHPRPQRSAHLHRLDRPPAGGAAADIIHQFAQGDAEGHFIQAPVLHIARDLDRHGAFRAVDAEAVIKARPAFGEDVRDGGERQHVVDHGRLAEQPFQRGQRRLGAHFAALAFEAVEQRGLLTADIGPRAHPHFAFERRDDVGALGQRRVQLADRIGIFAAAIDIALPRPDGVPGNRHAFDQLERIAFHKHPVGKGGAVAFIGIADDVFDRTGRARHGLPLDPRREPGPAATAQARGEHFFHGCLGADGARAVKARPAAGGGVIVKAGRAGLPRAGEGQALLALDEGMFGNRADRLGRGASENRVDIGQSGRAEALPIDLHQRFEPVHPPAGNPVHLVAPGRKGFGQPVGTHGAGQGIIGNLHKHQAFSITWVSAAASSRANNSSPTRALGPLEHRPRQ